MYRYVFCEYDTYYALREYMHDRLQHWVSAYIYSTYCDFMCDDGQPRAKSSYSSILLKSLSM